MTLDLSKSTTTFSSGCLRGPAWWRSGSLRELLEKLHHRVQFGPCNVKRLWKTPSASREPLGGTGEQSPELCPCWTRCALLPDSDLTSHFTSTSHSVVVAGDPELLLSVIIPPFRSAYPRVWLGGQLRGYHESHPSKPLLLTLPLDFLTPGDGCHLPS